jgi:DNA-binding response OmpR family regulator
MEKAKILIADDSVTIRKLIEMVLSSEGYDLHFVDNGLDLVKEAFKISPDLIISDVTMPIMNGYQACSFIKSQEVLHGIPVILLTAKTEKSDKFWGQKTGADTYITKPFQPDNLKNTVRGFLEKVTSSKREKVSISYTTEELLGYINDIFDKTY